MLDVDKLACVRGERRLFQDVSFALQDGALLYVHGSNGSGKTTLLRTLCGLVAPETGEVRWNGENIRELREGYYKDLAYVGHLNAIKDDFSAVENLRVSSALAGEPVSEGQAADALQRMGIAACAELPGKVLSQGQRRRVALARLLLGDKKLWIVDEPFNALDVKAVSVLQSVIGSHLGDGGMVVLTTHQEVKIAAPTAHHLHLGS